MTRLVLLVTALAACGGPSAPAAPAAPNNTGAAAGGAVYDALFEQGRTWTLDLVDKTTPPLDMGPPSEQRGAATCTVEMAHAMGEQRMAKITCTGAERTLYAPPGWWIADPRGLWHFDVERSADEVHAAMAKLDEGRMLLAAQPAARRKEYESEVDGLEAFEAKAGADGAWCVSYVMAMGDEAGYEVCLAPGRGIVSGSSFSAGATVFETLFTAK